MADNYLENKYESYLKRKEAERKEKCRIWKKRLDEYRKRTGAGQDPGKEIAEDKHKDTEKNQEDTI